MTTSFINNPNKKTYLMKGHKTQIYKQKVPKEIDE